MNFNFIFYLTCQYFKNIKNMDGQKQKIFTLNNNVIISSKFQSGNLSQAIEKSPNHYNLWIGPDHKSSYKTWFYFSVEGIEKNTTVTFTINNMNNQLKLFKQDHLPVFREEGSQMWERLKIPIQQNGIVKADDGFQLTFKHFFSKNTKFYFAFSYPWTTSDNDKFVDRLMNENKQKVFSSYEDLATTPCKKKVKILTLTKLAKNTEWKQAQIFAEDQSQFKPLIYQGKKGIFISARVHPGEVASSHIMNGILNTLFNFQGQFTKLLQSFVFYIVPIINPDGVDQGNFRTDSKGKNLNRCYTDPNKFEEPQIYMIKKFLIYMIKRNYIEFCLDLHAHVNKQGAFIYGNCIEDFKSQIQVCLFPKILAYNSPYFDYDACNFSEKNMSSKDKADDLSKQGASRVAIFKQTGLKACWTLECNYNSCKFINELKNQEPENLKSVSNGVLIQKTLPARKQQKTFLGLNEFHQIGRSICESILDYYSLRPTARYYAGKIKNHENFLINLGVEVLRMIPFRFDNNFRKILTGIDSNMNLSQHLDKLKKILCDLKIGQNTIYVFKEIKKNQQNSENKKMNERKLASEINNRAKTNENAQTNQKVHSLAIKKSSVQKYNAKPVQSKLSMNIGKVVVFPMSQGSIANKNKTKEIKTNNIPPRPPAISISRKPQSKNM